ncbi:MAG: hypothetical protein K2Z80_37535 [Xanthobacteraceae bacterium]|nr:hypothetical protein [Xanthobacteraceae bacterium]
MAAKPPPDDELAFSRSRSYAGGVVRISETRWQERPLLSMQLASEIAAISVGSLYRLAEARRLKLRTLQGRTLVETSSLVELIEGAPPWSPSSRGKEARAKRAAKRQKS